jgi:SAM-dependent methyltransferase
MTSETETYTHGHHESVVAQHAARTADECAAFLLPRLQPGMRLLDFGCGPGSITVGLAQAVAPGEVIAIDVVDDVLDGARELAREKGVTNVVFRRGSIYDTRFPELSFDVVYGHQVLQHLSRPVEALEEARRILKDGGVVGVRDSDYSTMAFTPSDGRLERFFQLYRDVARRNGGEPDAGRYLKGWLLDAGFTDIEMSTWTWTYDGVDRARQWGYSWAERITASALGQQAVDYGLAPRGELEELAAAWQEWAESTRAFGVVTHAAGLGWKR